MSKAISSTILKNAVKKADSFYEGWSLIIKNMDF